MSRKKRICILSEIGYDLITGRGDYVGGAEVQMTILAKELAKRSYDVSFVTFEKTSSYYEIFEGVKVYTTFSNRLRGFSYLLPQNIYKLIKILRKIDADVYIKKGYSPLTGVLAFIAKLQNKVFLFVASSDKDTSINLDISTITTLTNIFFRFGVKHCSKIICQTNHQKVLLKQKIGKNGIIIKNLYPLPKIEGLKRDSQRLKILWIGRLVKGKRPELFLKLAKKMPDYKFWIIMLSSILDLKYYSKIKKAADKIDNLDFLGKVPYKEINKYYRDSSMLVSTSLSEGFPNTFLEAWGNSIPVISIGFDPDEIICKRGLGIHVENFNDLLKNTYMLLKNDKLREKMGIQGRKYVEKEHNVNRIVDEYEKLFNEIMNRRRKG